MPLYALLGIGVHDFVSFSGAGGKTTLVFHLCDELMTQRMKTLVTTTTKMFYPSEFPGSVVVRDDSEIIDRAVLKAQEEPLFAAASHIPRDKVKGFAPEVLDVLFARFPAMTILVETDGAAMKPYKFYHADEPVVPASTTVHVHVIGSDVLGYPMDDSLIHRCPAELAGELFDLDRFEGRMAWFARERLTGFQGESVLVINKADEGREEIAEGMREVARPYFDSCLAVSLQEKRWRA